MKKILMYGMLVCCMCVFNSCELIEKLTFRAEIKVLKDGQPLKGETVYQFDADQYNNGTMFLLPSFSDKQVITNEDGVAMFETIMEPDLEVLNQQTFYYIVFDKDKTTILGEAGITIKSGETKQATIDIKSSL